MRYLLLVLFWTGLATAQVVGPGFVDYVTSAPSGTCSQGQHQQNVLGNGQIWTCQTGTWTQVGGGGGGVAFNAITGGTNTTAAMIVGTGASLASVPQFNIGAVGTAGVLGLVGSTSGTATFTAPAVAGTTTNPIVSSNALSLPNGTISNPSILLGSNNEIWSAAGNDIEIGLGATEMAQIATSAIYFRTPICEYTAGTNCLTFSAGLISTTGAGTPAFQANAYQTKTNCSSGASPAVCGSAAAGSVAVPAGTNSTLQVNTTAVTANSQILVQSDETLGTKLSVTCNSTLASLITEPVVSARSGGASFTITISGTTTTNPVCLSYFIVN